jgi:hypothetical protein
MRSLPADLTTELAKEYNSLKQLVEISFLGGTVRLTDADRDIFYDSFWWISYGLTLDPAQYFSTPKVDSISFEVANVNRMMSNIILTEETRGRSCIVYRVALDNNLHVIGAASPSFVGYLDAIDLDSNRIRFDVYNHFVRWEMKTPKRIHQALCRRTYGDTRCGVSGSWCDHTWDRCVVLGNSLNFGGFRWIAALKDKEIWWGRVPPA